MKRQFVPIGGFKKNSPERGDAVHSASPAPLSEQETIIMLPAADMQAPPGSTALPPFPSGQLPPPSWQPPGYQGNPAPFQQGPSQPLPPLPLQPLAQVGGPPPLPPPSNTRLRRKQRFPIWTRIAVGILLLLLILVGSGAYYYYTNFADVLGNTTGQTVNRLGGDNPDNGRGNNGGNVPNTRTNILLLGSDTDIKFTNTDGSHSYLAQTDIVLTVDPNSKSVGMLSIPRDTVLKAANNQGFMKLDQVYQRGGVALSLATIHQDFGIYTNHYAWVGLDGFIKVIDTVGGVDVDVLHPVTDDLYPDDTGTHKSSTDTGYTRLSIAPGPQHLDGMHALEYVRSRHSDLNGDFGRSTRQQQVLNQLKTRLNTPSIIGQLPTLARDLNGYVKTDMSVTDVLNWMNFARSIDSNKINRVVLDTRYSHIVDQYVIPGQESAGSQSVVFLDCNAVRPLVASMFALGNNAKCDTGVNTDGSLTTNTLSQPISAITPVTSVTTIPTAMDLGTLWQSITQIGDLGHGASNNLFGIRSLLNLLFLAVFESPAALQT